MIDDLQTWMLLGAVFAPLLAGLLTLALPARAVVSRVALAAAGPATSVGLLAAHLVRFGLDAPAVHVPFVPSIELNLAFNADPLGAFFGLLVSGIGVLIVLYARGYFGPDQRDLGRFYPTLAFFTTAMMGLVLSDSMLGMFLFWEMTSVSSFLLIGWDRENPKAVRLALQAFLTTAMGGLALLAGLILVGLHTNAWTFSGLYAWIAAHNASELPTAAFLLIFLGAAAKSAQFPLHYWLPGAMAAPTPVSAFLHSATMVKAGVYLFGRLFPVLGEHPLWTPMLASFGAVTMLLGGYLALRSVELKKIFAYTTVSQLGLLTCAYGLGGLAHAAPGGGSEANLIWPVTQILNHALYKAPLFIIAGAIMHVAGKKELPQCRGLFFSHRVLTVVLVVAAYALAGGPLTLSFVAKEAFLYQVVHAAAHAPAWWLVGAMAVATAAFNVAIFVRICATVFARAADAPTRTMHGPHASDDNPPAHDAGHPGHHDHAEGGLWGALVWIPAAVILLGQLVGGLMPGVFTSLVTPLETHPLYWDKLPSLFYALTHPSMALALSGVAIALGLVIGLSGLWRSPVTDPANRLFPAVFRGLERFGYRSFYAIQTGNMRWYVTAVLVTLLAVIALVLIDDPRSRAVPVVSSLAGADAGLILAAVLLTGLVCATSLIMLVIRRRVVRVLVLGAAGFSVTGMYLIYQAPDLALTQLMFEIISVVLFLLVLRLLPDDPKRTLEAMRVPRVVLGAAVGLAVGLGVLQAGSVADTQNPGTPLTTLASGAPGQLGDASLVPVADGEAAALLPDPDRLDSGRLGPWFLRHSYKGSPETDMRSGGGKNVVNVILVDFRGYDTLGEITVLGIAVIGVLAMLASTPGVTLSGAARRSDALTHSPYAQPHLRSRLLRTSMSLILPLTLLFAGYVFFKGHNAPGGGFIAGLIASVALAVFRMSEGHAALRRLLPLKPATTVAIGLVVALGTGLVPMLLGYPLLTSGHWYIPLPGGDTFHLTSAMFFDTGVFIVVVGASVGIVNRLEEELE